MNITGECENPVRAEGAGRSVDGPCCLQRGTPHSCGVDARRGGRHAHQTAGEPRARARSFRRSVSAIHLQGAEHSVQNQSLQRRCSKHFIF